MATTSAQIEQLTEGREIIKRLEQINNESFRNSSVDWKGARETSFLFWVTNPWMRIISHSLPPAAKFYVESGSLHILKLWGKSDAKQTYP